MRWAEESPPGKVENQKKKKKPMRWSQREARRERLNEDKPMRRAGESSPGKAETKLGGGAEKACRAEREQVLSYFNFIDFFISFLSALLVILLLYPTSLPTR